MKWCVSKVEHFLVRRKFLLFLFGYIPFIVENLIKVQKKLFQKMRKNKWISNIVVVVVVVLFCPKKANQTNTCKYVTRGC